MNATDQPGDADSYQTGRTYSAGEISRRVKRRRRQPTEEARGIAEQLLAEIIQHERDTAARRAAEGDTNPYDLDDLEYVRDLADRYAKRGTDPERITATLDSLTDELDLADVRALRVAAEAAAEITPRLIRLAADVHGMKAPIIAAELGVTESYVYRILREQRPTGDQ